MKKALSLVLAIIMAFSACGLLVSAADGITVDELPVVPEQTEGKIYFAADSKTGVKAGDTVDIPVYLVSNYTTAVNDGFVELGFEFACTGYNCTVNSVTFADGIKAVNGFTALDCQYGIGDSLYFTDNDKGYVAFAAGLEALKQNKVQVATVNVTVGEGFNADYDEEDVEARSDFVALELYPFNFGNVSYGLWFDGAGAVIEGSAEELLPTCDMAAIAEDLAPVDGSGEGVLAFGNGALMGNVPKEKWSLKLIDWFRKAFEDIFAEIDKIRAIFLTLIDALKMAV